MNWYLFDICNSYNCRVRVTTVLPILEVLKRYLKDDPRCLELFARNLWPNWTSWGNEVCTSWPVKQLFIFFFKLKKWIAFTCPFSCTLGVTPWYLYIIAATNHLQQGHPLWSWCPILVYTYLRNKIWVKLNWIESFMLHLHTKNR